MQDKSTIYIPINLLEIEEIVSNDKLEHKLNI
jgi:hypothetical protein